MALPTDTLLDALAGHAGLGCVRKKRPLDGGSNNRVYRLECESGTALLKEYHRDPADPRDRLAAEFGFSTFAWNTGVRALPRPLAQDRERGLALYEFIEGRKLAPGEPGLIHVEQAFKFYESLNLRREEGSMLPTASEACFSIAEHVALVARRVERLSGLAGGSPSRDEASAFVRGPLAAAFARESERALNGKGAQDVLPKEDRRISPSDFGFHNALVGTDGILRFIDFEYAGWDDPAKMVCDFFCQPAVPAPKASFDSFAERTAATASDPEACLSRIKRLRAMYHLKWCCILLNDFLPLGENRRRFAGNSAGEPALAAQLGKARTALASA